MTTADRRLDVIEATLSPTERVVRWLVEAHQYPDLVTHARATMDANVEATTLDRLVRATQATIRAEHRRPTPEVDKLLHEATRDVVFRFHLAVRIIEVTDRAQERAELVLLALTLMLNLAYEMRSARQPNGLPSVEQIRDLLFQRAADLDALQTARETVERRYLGGQTALFPDAVAQWADLLYRSRTMAMPAWGLTDRLGGAPLDEARYGLPDPEHVEACVADLVELAGIKALDAVGESRAAVARAIRWMGPTVTPGSVGPP